MILSLLFETGFIFIILKLCSMIFNVDGMFINIVLLIISLFIAMGFEGDNE